MEAGRKRIRSQESDVVQQRKYFINQKIVDQNDKQKMEKIYEKTLNMMFSSRRKSHNKSVSNSSHESSFGAEEIDTVDDKPHSNQGCKFCLNDIDASKVNSSCRNCNLPACFRCRSNCSYCSANLCFNCVNIFGCCLTSEVNDSVLPICEDCKQFVD